MAVSKQASRAYPSIPTVGTTLESHAAALNAIKEAMEIGERRTNKFEDSFVRVSELQALGFIDSSGNAIDITGSGGGAETDPIFAASAAATITSLDIANWNTPVNLDGYTQAAVAETITANWRFDKGDGTGITYFDNGQDVAFISNDGVGSVTINHNNSDFRYSVTGARFNTLPFQLGGFLEVRSTSPFQFQERAAANTPLIGWGQLWVKNDTPNVLYFTDDAGTDHNLLAGGGSATSLSIGTQTTTTLGITSDGAVDDVILPEATATEAGLLSSPKLAEIIANTIKVTNATHTGEVTGATALTVDVTAISNRSPVVADSTDDVAIRDSTDGTIKKTSLNSITDAGYF